jgi:hypothetical protein
MGQVILNHFYYGAAPLALIYTGAVVDVATDFATIVLPKLVQVLSTGTVFTNIDIQEHVSGTGVASLSLTTGNVGVQAGDAMPAFNAWALRSVRTNAQVPRAHKRFGGLSEGSVVNGVMNPVLATDMTNLVSVLNESFNALNGGVTDLIPLAITRVDNTVTPHVPRPVPLFEPITYWEYQKVTSQVSRRS